MREWHFELTETLQEFLEVARIAGVRLTASDYLVEILDRPHRPPTQLPSGKMALYAFHGDDGWLKIGIAGAKSQARYTSQHYNAGSAPSTLAARLMADPYLANRGGVGARDWICENCHRANVLLDVRLGRPLLFRLEAYAHTRLKPRYEGRTVREQARG